MSKPKASVLIKNLIALSKEGRDHNINEGYLCAENEACDGLAGMGCPSCPLDKDIDISALEDILPLILMQELVDE